MRYLRNLLYIPLAASLLFAPACSRNPGDYAGEKTTQDAGSHGQRRINLDRIELPAGVNIISRQTNPSSNKHVAVVLERHPRSGSSEVDQEAMREQPMLYGACSKLVEAGFRSVSDETFLREVPLERYIEEMRNDDPSVDFSELQNTKDPQKAKKAVLDKYIGKGYETSWLVKLTYKDRVNYIGAATPEMLARQVSYRNLLLNVEEFVKSGKLERLKRLYRRNPRREEVVNAVIEFNSVVDYLDQDYDWFMKGRITELLGRLLDGPDDLIFLTGTNHSISANDYLSSRKIDSMVICAGCTLEGISTFEKELERTIKKELPKLKFRSGK